MKLRHNAHRSRGLNSTKSGWGAGVGGLGELNLSEKVNGAFLRHLDMELFDKVNFAFVEDNLL